MNDILFKSSTNIEMKKKLEVKAAFIYRRILELSSSLMRLHIKGEKRQRRGEGTSLIRCGETYNTWLAVVI